MRTIHKGYESLSYKGLFQKLIKHYIYADRESVILDFTTIRADACAAGYYTYFSHKELLGRLSDVFATEIHIAVDVLYAEILGETPVMPSKSNFIKPQEYDKHIYKERIKK